MKKRVGLIGLGHQAINDYLPALTQNPHTELVAICDINDKQLTEWAAKLEVNPYSDYKQLFAQEELDFVIAVAPHDVYRGIIECAAHYGVHILKEKPFARTAAEAQYFQELCIKGKIHLMTTLQRRFNPIYKLFFQFMPEIGELEFVEAKYTMFLNNPLAGWRGNKDKSGGGTLIDMGYHMVDLLIWYFGLPNKVFANFKATSTPEITSTICFNYDSGLQGVMILSRNYPPKTEYLKIIGTQGVVEVGKNYIKRMARNGEVLETVSQEVLSPTTAAKQINYFCQVLDGQCENFDSPAYHLQHAQFIDACYLSQELKQFVQTTQLEELCLLN